MSEENVERLRAGYEAWNQGDRGPFLDRLHPDVEFQQAPGFPGMGIYRGADAVVAALDDLQDAFEDFRGAPERIIDVDDERLIVFVQLTGRGRGGGVPFEASGAHLFTLRDGKIIRWVAYWDRSDALEAVGLSE